MKPSLRGLKSGVRIFAIAFLAVLALALGYLRYEVRFVSETLSSSAEAIRLGRAGTIITSLESLEKRTGYRMLSTLRLPPSGDVERLRCEAYVHAERYVDAVNVCAEALKVSRSDEDRSDIKYHRAVALIHLAGKMPKVLSLAVEDLKGVLRSGEHSEAAYLLEKILLLRSGEGDGQAANSDDGEPLFDGPGSSGAGAGQGGF